MCASDFWRVEFVLFYNTLDPVMPRLEEQWTHPFWGGFEEHRLDSTIEEIIQRNHLYHKWCKYNSMEFFKNTSQGIVSVALLYRWGYVYGIV